MRPNINTLYLGLAGIVLSVVLINQVDQNITTDHSTTPSAPAPALPLDGLLIPDSDGRGSGRANPSAPSAPIFNAPIVQIPAGADSLVASIAAAPATAAPKTQTSAAVAQVQPKANYRIATPEPYGGSNFRATPNGAMLRDPLPDGTAVYKTGVQRGRWHEIVFEGKYGWIWI